MYTIICFTELSLTFYLRCHRHYRRLLLPIFPPTQRVTIVTNDTFPMFTNHYDTVSE